MFNNMNFRLNHFGLVRKYWSYKTLSYKHRLPSIQSDITGKILVKFNSYNISLQYYATYRIRQIIQGETFTVFADFC